MGLSSFPNKKGTITLRRNRPKLKTLIRSPTMAIALGFGTGLAPVVPGTVGTLVALPLWWLLSGFDSISYLVLVGAAFILGVWVCGRAETMLGQHDHSSIVFDEIVGYLLALIVVPATFWGVLFSFVTFRLLDVFKPWPISWLDRHVTGGLGVMLDDLVAGLCTALIMIVAREWGML